jgi:dystrophin
MESQLQHLGKRWAAICTWTEQQWLLLQDVLLKWQHFSDEQVKFSDWLSQKEAILEKFQQSDLSQLPIQSVTITTVVSSNLDQGKVYNII